MIVLILFILNVSNTGILYEKNYNRFFNRAVVDRLCK